MWTKRLTPPSFASSSRSRVPLDHDPLELLGLPLPNRDEVDDDVDALERAPDAGRIGHVALDELAAERFQRPRLAPAPNEAAHRPVRPAQRVHDVPTDEPGTAGDEDHLAGSRSKFCQ